MATSKASDNDGDTQHLLEAEAEVEAATERTNLLGSSSLDGGQALAGTDSWDGLDDFKDDPWWRIPSVCRSMVTMRW